jgi:HSP20 family molecular chaperone IbpA
MEKNLSKSANVGVATVGIVPARVLADRQAEIREMIARRAYDLYERRGCVHGRDFDDWIQAENEFILPCQHGLRESEEGLILNAEMPLPYSADQLQISVEPKRLMVSGERALYSSSGKAGTDLHAQRLFRVFELPVEVDPSGATAILEHGTLTVKMPKAGTSERSGVKAKAAGS